MEVQDRLGCLFMDYRGTSSVSFSYSIIKLLAMYSRGVLLGLFIGMWSSHGSNCSCLNNS
jgi:hypothetical protein